MSDITPAVLRKAADILEAQPEEEYHTALIEMEDNKPMLTLKWLDEDGQDDSMTWRLS